MSFFCSRYADLVTHANMEDSGFFGLVIRSFRQEWLSHLVCTPTFFRMDFINKRLFIGVRRSLRECRTRKTFSLDAVSDFT